MGRVLDDAGNVLAEPDADEPMYAFSDETTWPEQLFDRALERFANGVDGDELAEQVESIVSDPHHPMTLRLEAAFDALVAHGYCRLVDIRLAAITDGRFVA
jgi:hypothetical protein